MNTHQNVNKKHNLLSNELNNSTQPQLNTVQLFSGGGWRFGYYTGSYACLYEHGLKPDLIIASCGGSLASLLVDIAPHPKDLYEVIQSPQLHKIICACRATPIENKGLISSIKRNRPHHIYNVLKRWYKFQRKNEMSLWQKNETFQELINELHYLALFEIENEKNWLDDLIGLKKVFSNSETDNETNGLNGLNGLNDINNSISNLVKQNLSLSNLKVQPPEIAIVASRIYPMPKHQSAPKLQHLLFAKSAILNKVSPVGKCPTHQYAPQRLLEDIELIDLEKNSIAHAVRASMADMYYLKPTYVDVLGWCLGGVIDLTPIELACHLGRQVYAETKSAYNPIVASPAIKRVFGFDPNQRLHDVHNYRPMSETFIHWLPFKDNSQALKGQHVKKRVNLKYRNIELINPSFERFKSQMQAQWEFGYNRTLQYINMNHIKS